jgi:hypothetical protein
MINIFREPKPIIILFISLIRLMDLASIYEFELQIEF